MSVTGLSSLFQTVVSEFSKATEVLSPTHDAMDSIYWDYNPQEKGVVGQTVNVIIPQDPTSNVNDIGTGNLIVSDVGVNTTPIVLNRHPSYAFNVKDFEQTNTPWMIQQNLVQASMVGIRNEINAVVAGLFNSTNFNVNAVVSTTGGVITVTQFLGAQAALADAYVPVTDDPRNMTLLLPATPYMKMQDPTTGGAGAAWSQAFIVGNTTAEQIHGTGKVPVAFGTSFKMDQQMPTVGGAGSRTFTGALFHRFAVGGVSRPIATPPEAMKVAEVANIEWKGITLRVILGWNQYPFGGNIFQVDAAYGVKVVRPQMGVCFSTAE